MYCSNQGVLRRATALGGIPDLRIGRREEVPLICAGHPLGLLLRGQKGGLAVPPFPRSRTEATPPVSAVSGGLPSRRRSHKVGKRVRFS